MPVCDYCHLEMSDLVACTIPTYDDVPGYGPLPRIPYPPGPFEEEWPANCYDCGTPHGGLHHPGCDAERCPSPDHPGMQAISCSCGELDDD
jgi:hypothetical protein